MHRLRRNTKGKTPAIVWVIVLVGIIVVVSGGVELGGLLSFGGQAGLVNVNKQIKFHMVYEYGGSPIASKTDKFNLYDSGGANILEANLDTDANGLMTTGSDYASGSVLYLRYEDSNDKQWWKVTVPQMNEKDAESATYNLIRLNGFTIGTYTTDALKTADGTAYADASTYNITLSGTTPHFIYSLVNTGNDNTGLKTSYDPEYQHNWNIEMYITFSGTDYEKLIIYDLDYDFTLGTTHYVGQCVDAYKLTKHKVGMTYRSLGTQDVSFWIDATGYTASTSVTMQITVKAYADHVYAQNHGGSFGPEAIELAEQTVTIVDT